jgi:phosphopantetheinyl transferase
MKALGDRRRVPWLYGRIAAKDAVRAWLLAHGDGPRFPVELTIASDDDGRPLVRGPFAQDLRISLAHKEALAVAIVREGAPCGVDVERIEPRDERLRALMAAPDEQALFPPGADPDEWTTRCFCAKEAVGKARGTGLQGSPRSLPLTAVEPEPGAEGRWRLRCAGEWVVTERRGDAIVGWTPPAET